MIGLWVIRVRIAGPGTKIRDIGVSLDPDISTWSRSTHPSDVRHYVRVDALRQPEVLLRPPRLGDESQVAQAQAELAADDFEFVFQQADESWPAYVARVEREQRGRDLGPDRVPNTFLVADVGGEVVGRVSIRHELNDYLAILGGHIGYAVRPAYRRRGYARSILRQSLHRAKALGLHQVLITCDDDNVASARLIESFGGILDNVITPDGSPSTRRYWIDLTGLTE